MISHHPEVSGVHTHSALTISRSYVVACVRTCSGIVVFATHHPVIVFHTHTSTLASHCAVLVTVSHRAAVASTSNWISMLPVWFCQSAIELTVKVRAAPSISTLDETSGDEEITLGFDSQADRVSLTMASLIASPVVFSYVRRYVIVPHGSALVSSSIVLLIERSYPSVTSASTSVTDQAGSSALSSAGSTHQNCCTVISPATTVTAKSFGNESFINNISE